MIEEIKKVVNNFLENAQLTELTTGTYRGGKVYLHEDLEIPAAMLSGIDVASLTDGDRVQLLRNKGGGEYSVINIIGRDVNSQIKALEARVKALEDRLQ